MVKHGQKWRKQVEFRFFVKSRKSIRRNEAFDVRFPKKVCLKVIQGEKELHLDISFAYFGI